MFLDDFVSLLIARPFAVVVDDEAGASFGWQWQVAGESLAIAG
jgi:hypothetical protein